ncbi:MAG TPA: transcriptional repressor [Hyphomicrobiaceae bacterium]|nr:transcriptional repressor [Hyphomicrobiaceae bacterium]
MSKSTNKSPTLPRKTISAARLAQSIERARTIFTEKNLRFTDLRQRVFSEIAATNGAIGAYDILDRLSDKGTRLAPISVYRSIDALLDAGVIHRLESKNAYFACRRHEHGKHGRPIFLSCERCGSVTEAEAQGVFELINSVARDQDFEAKVKFVEVSGICVRCAGSPPRNGAS